MLDRKIPSPPAELPAYFTSMIPSVVKAVDRDTGPRLGWLCNPSVPSFLHSLKGSGLHTTNVSSLSVGEKAKKAFVSSIKKAFLVSIPS